MLKPAEYRVMLSGQEIARGEIRPRRLLAMNPLQAAHRISKARSRWSRHLV